MRYFAQIIILFFVSFQSFAQTDSLNYTFQNATGEEKYSLLIQLAEDLGMEDGTEITDHGTQALELAKQLDDREKIADSYVLIGLGNFYLNNYDIAIDNYLKALRIIEELLPEGDLREPETEWGKINDKIAGLKIKIANVYSKLKNYKIAIEFYETSLSLYKLTKNKRGIAQVYQGLASTLNAENNYQEALSCYKKSLDYYINIKDSTAIADVYINTGLVYIKQENYNKTSEYLNKALYIYEKTGDKKMQARALFNLGVLQGNAGIYDNKVIYFYKALKILESIGDVSGISMVQDNIAQYYFIKQKYEKSERYLNKALQNAKLTGKKDYITDIYQHFSELYAAIDNFEKAFEYQQIYEQKKDSLYRESKEKIADMRMNYETEKRKKENELLKKEAEINELIINKQKSLRNYLILLLIFIVILAVVIYSRYTFKIKTNKLLAKQKQQLEIANMTKDKFFSIIAHDLKNPIAASNSLSDLLYDNFQDLTDDQKYDIIKTIKKSAAFTYNLLENLLQWSLSQSGRIKFNPKTIDLEKIISNNLSLLAGNAQKKDISLISFVDKNTFILADEDMISLVIRNLISNAIKFSNHGEEVRVKAKTEENNITVSVEDNGIGMSKEDLMKIFRIDVNITAIGKSKEKGTGLGLILCKEFVEKNGGKIWAESELGKGSIFNFTLERS
ncbi:MAG: tetratricopeptide repeat-containing sensor histidine kinase [Bacteroidales bacterium]|nr:tetratricopeptide repeat-containing sensor histidine kinase [Bacteroidales bacterium]